MMPCSFSLSPEIEIKKQKFYSKNNFHISLLYIDKYALVLANAKNISVKKATSEITKISKQFLSQNSIEFKKLSPDIRLVSKDSQSSIIVMVKLLGINKFSKYLTTELGIKVESPSTHVTLFTSKNSTGIGVDDKNDLDNLTTPLNKDNREIVKKSIISYKF